LNTNKKTRGRPFQKGADPRRNLTGGSSPKAKQDFKAQFKAIFEDEATPGRLRRIIRALFRKAEAGQPWAISEVLNRALGKPAQAVDLNAEASKDIRITYMFGEPALPQAADTKSKALPEARPAPVGILDAPGVKELAPADLTDAELEREIARAEAEGEHGDAS